MPAVPCAIAGDRWAADHFAKQGPALAAQIAAASERNAVLRRWCERALLGESAAVLLMGLVMYSYPPLLHWGIAPGPAEMLGVPVAGRRPETPPPPTPATAAGAPPPRPPGPAPGAPMPPSANGDEPPAYAVPEQHFPTAE